MLGFLAIAMYHGLMKIKHYDETKKITHNSQILGAKENLKLSIVGHSCRKASATKPSI